MKITRKAVKQFESDRLDGNLKHAIDTFIATLADDLDTNFRYSQREVERDINEHGEQVALQNIQWQIASKLLDEIKMNKPTKFRNK